jgi:hypothetical protein
MVSGEGVPIVSFLRRPLTGDRVCATDKEAGSGWTSWTKRAGMSLETFLLETPVREVRFFEVTSFDCSAAGCSGAAGLSDLARFFGDAISTSAPMLSTGAGVAVLGVVFPALFGELPAVARFLTAFTGATEAGSPVREKLGSVICEWKGIKWRAGLRP